MVTPLKYYRSDPKKKGRGDGYYYHRGKGIYSKYSGDRDKKVMSRGYNVDSVGLPKGSKYRHITDGKIVKWTPVVRNRKKGTQK